MTPSDENGSGAGWLALFLVLVLAVLAFAVALATAIGDYSIGLRTVTLAITNGLGLTGADIPPIEASVVWDLRLSRALVAALAGAGLAICGAILQALLRNALAEPFVLGVSAGASTGAVCVIVLVASEPFTVIVMEVPSMARRIRSPTPASSTPG